MNKRHKQIARKYLGFCDAPSIIEKSKALEINL
jgi:hypothetical protein